MIHKWYLCALQLAIANLNHLLSGVDVLGSQEQPVGLLKVLVALQYAAVVSALLHVESCQCTMDADAVKLQPCTMANKLDVGKAHAHAWQVRVQYPQMTGSAVSP